MILVFHHSYHDEQSHTHLSSLFIEFLDSYYSILVRDNREYTSPLDVLTYWQLDLNWRCFSAFLTCGVENSLGKRQVKFQFSSAIQELLIHITL